MNENELLSKENTENDKTPEEIDGMPMEFHQFTQQAMHFMMRSETAEHPLVKHLTPEHITQTIKNDDKKDLRKFWLTIILAVFALVILGFVVLVFREQPDILIPVLTLLFGSGLGFGGGYGIGKSKRG
ncbi:MAG: hypothetical protein FWD06_00495 [Oscillospiraceae bacterium]|nr:hypothetical protein [Oscillospiraceae bacterium]